MERYYVYILYSRSADHFYVGHTKDVGDRLVRHNQGRITSTKYGRPCWLVQVESFGSGSGATQRERQIKSKKDREYIIQLIMENEIGWFRINCSSTR